MSKSRYRVYIEKDPVTNLFAARCLEISVFSQGRDEQEAVKNIKKAIRLHIELLKEETSGKKLTIGDLLF